ncbi:ABC transporter permease [Barrientosiimonas marina]|uniref:ABC transporter permease n=1 Tax=Lentibacillus kimchii TaxID=1542911 RepID=A0ABW2UTT7_9BACI
MNEQTAVGVSAGKRKKWSIRKKAVLMIVLAALLLTGMLAAGWLISPDKLAVNLAARNGQPSLGHLFGTDWMGRDMLARTFKGLTLSFGVGVLASLVSVIIALLLSLLASVHQVFDTVVTWLIDLFLSLPHIVILILISFALGGGFKGVIVGLALTHWPALTRLLRAEVLPVLNTDYVAISRRLGRSRFWIARQHLLPHLTSQLLIGFVLLFPHVILHEAAITFLGFGLPADVPAIGVILSESMRYLSTGMWWLAFFPGLMLLLMVGTFDMLGRHVRKLADPFHSQNG